MIQYQNGLFILNTLHTTYAFHVMTTGHLEHLYYGSKIDLSMQGAEALMDHSKYQAGNVIAYHQEHLEVTMENRCLEVSSYGKGDIREPFVVIKNADGSYTSDFIYDRHRISLGHRKLKGLPSAYSEQDELEEEYKLQQNESQQNTNQQNANQQNTNEQNANQQNVNQQNTDQQSIETKCDNADDHQVMTLSVTLKSMDNKVELEIVYTVFPDCDCITRSSRVYNLEQKSIEIERLMSVQIDFADSDYNFVHFNGAWAREMHKYVDRCQPGKIVNSSITGTSSNRSNPYVMLAREGASEMYGECFGFNLIYSGNHYECADTGAFDTLRFVSGINPEQFLYEVPSGFEFQAPEAVMSYSDQGFNGLSHNMHQFVREHIVRGYWKNRPRPIVFNSWEASYFKFDESKLLKLAKKANSLGMELFVLDDGWFGERNSDSTSLGDWNCNMKKLPSGIAGIAQKIKEIGMDFGIWVEPEMVNVDSECYKNHPEWTVEIPGKMHSEGRNQRILNLTLQQVRDYLVEQMTNVFSIQGIKYVKWDMNRIFSDSFSISLKHQQEFAHRYILGLYEVLDKLMNAFPDILFEGCAAGGNRFDLGMLCYFPQIWASDNTDAWCRSEIQTGYSYGYPMSVIGAHVSGCPNHQTLRNISIETRFNVAMFGQLGYECNVLDLSEEDTQAVKKQIEFYKSYRDELFMADYYRISSGKQKKLGNEVYEWISISKDKRKAVAFQMQNIVIPNMPFASIRTIGLDDHKMYHFYNRELKHNVKKFGDLVNVVSPVHIKQDSLMHQVVSKFVKMDGEKEDYIVSGSLLNHAGLRLKQNFCATGYDADVRYYQDFDSRIYAIEEVSKEENVL